MNEPIVRTAGQSPLFAGTTSVGDLVWTSGLVSPSALAAAEGEEIPGDVQIREAMDLLRVTLTAAGVGVDRVVKVEAFLSSPHLFTAWNEQFTAMWPAPGPARITLVVDFVVPMIDFEIQVTAVR